MPDLSIKFDIRKFEGEMDEAYDAIHDGAVRGMDRGADVLLGHKRKQMQAGTYAVPERIGADGQKEWQRTGNWLKGQGIAKTGDLERVVTTTGPAEAYERRLSDLPTGPDGINRTNNAAAKAATIFEPQFAPIVEEGIVTEFRARGIKR